MKALDLYCGDGGAGRGLRELGFKAMGIPLGAMTTAEISDAGPSRLQPFIAEQFPISRPTPHTSAAFVEPATTGK